MIRLATLVVAWLAASTTEALAQTPRSKAKPNVVVIVADDLGWNDVGFHNPEVRSPNLDRLVQEGVRLDRHYSYPICSCTRAALLTGMSTSRTSVTNSSGLDLAYRLMPESFQAAGYQTWMRGKWHLGGAEGYERSGPEFLPHRRGFDDFYGLLHGVIDYQTHVRNDIDKLDWWRNGEAVKEPGFTTDLLADDAVKKLKGRDKARPVFLYLAFNAVHGPLTTPPGSNVSRRERRPTLLANVASMDAAIGRVLKTIDDEGMRDDTIVLFFSDNGGQLSQGASNAPLRAEKGTVFEGGIHTPATVRWPGVLKAGTSSKQVISVIDWFPTLADASGVEPKTHRAFDGKDLWKNLVEGKATPPEALVIAQGAGTAVFDGPWKLVIGPEQNAERQDAATKKAARAASQANPQLFRIDDDPEEKTNMAARFPEIVKDLRAKGQAMTSLTRRRRP
jgi:arylsulfatase A-like enzyme